MQRRAVHGTGENKRRVEYAVHMGRHDEMKPLAHRRDDVLEIFPVRLGNNDRVHTGAVGGHRFFPQTADGEDTAAQRNFACHGDVMTHQTAGQAETRAVAIVIPAEGPSFGIAPSGKWMCISHFL